jgi:hypothetical protein
MSDKKYTYIQLVDKVMDTMSDWFENSDATKISHPSLAIMIMSEAMNKLKENGYCQHDTVDMIQGAVDQYIDMEVTFAKEEGIEPFLDDCGHDNDRISFVEAMKPISKRNYN